MSVLSWSNFSGAILILSSKITRTNIFAYSLTHSLTRLVLVVVIIVM
jgi:hypothetical protein